MKMGNMGSYRASEGGRSSLEGTPAPGKTIVEAKVQILVVGHSHSTSLARALEKAPDPDVRVINLRSEENADLADGRAPSEALRDEFSPTHVFSMIGGNSYYHIGLLEHEDQFQFLYAREDRDIDPERTLITHEMMRRLLYRMAQPHLDMMCRLQDIFRLPLSHILSPPPLGVADIAPLLPPGFQKANTHGVVPPSLRLRLYWMQCDILREHCESADIAIIGPPAEACTPVGYLKRRYAGWNATHAGHKYGALVLAQLQAAVKG